IDTAWLLPPAWFDCAARGDDAAAGRAAKENNRKRPAGIPDRERLFTRFCIGVLLGAPDRCCLQLTPGPERDFPALRQFFFPRLGCVRPGIEACGSWDGPCCASGGCTTFCCKPLLWCNSRAYY